MLFPEQPTENIWQSLGQAATQGAGIYDNLRKDQIESQQRQNVLQDLVARRTAAVLEQQRQAREDAQKEWEFNKKQEDEKKADAARQEVNALLTKGVKVPGVSSVIPPKTENVPGPWAPSQLPASAPYDVPEAGMPVTPVTTPEQAVTAPDSYRPATPQDIRDALYKNEQLSAKDYTDLSPFDKAKATAAGTIAGYTADNHSDFMSKAASYVQNKLAADPTKPPSMAEVDAAAAFGDPQGNRFSDKAYQAYIKSFDKGAAAQNSQSGVTRLGIGQQNADAHTLEAKTGAAKSAAAAAVVPGSALTEKQVKERNKWQQALQNKYESSTTSTRSGTNLQAASNAYETINKTLDAPSLSAADVTAVKDQVAKLLNPGFAISKVQFAHLNTGGLLDDVKNWTDRLSGGNVQLTQHQKQQYQTLVDRLGEELRSAHSNIQKDFWTQAHKLSTRSGWNGDDSISLTPKEFAFDANTEPSPSVLDGLGISPPSQLGSAPGVPKIGDTKLNSHGVKVVFGPGGWTLAQ